MLNISQRTPDCEDIALGFRIRKIRQDQKRTLREVSEKIGVSKQQLRKYELGRNKISARRLGQIAHILGVSTDYLIEGGAQNERGGPIDREMQELWVRLRRLEHKHTILAISKLIANQSR